LGALAQQCQILNCSYNLSIVGRGGTLPFWEFGGSAIVSEDRIRLTPALQSRVGWVWNSVVRLLLTPLHSLSQCLDERFHLICRVFPFAPPPSRCVVHLHASRQAADMDAWEVQMDFEIGGGGSRGADGMAFWYVAEPKKEGISMGSAEEYRGMAVYFDTFDNDGQVQLCARLATHHRTHTRTTKVRHGR